MLYICERVVTLYNHIPNVPLCAHMVVYVIILLSDETIRVIMYTTLTIEHKVVTLCTKGIHFMIVDIQMALGC